MTIRVSYDPSIDQFIDVTLEGGAHSIPLDLAGTGLLQAIQILAYLHLFSPKMIILDEPDSHLHPNNQRLLCSLLSSVSSERDVQVLITTHSRHVLDTMYNDAHILWVQDGVVAEVRPEDQVDVLLDLGALDIREKVRSGRYRVIFLTEDKRTTFLQILLTNSGFPDDETAILPYYGVTSIHLLKPLIRQIAELSEAQIFVHRDRDYLDPDEVEVWKKEIRSLGAEPFVTAEIDVEGYFCTDDYIKFSTKDREDLVLNVLKQSLIDGDQDDIVSAYINGRIDHERKRGTIGKIDYGQLSVSASKRVSAAPLEYMKGKRKLAKLRHVLQSQYGIRYDIVRDAAVPVDKELQVVAEKYFRRLREANVPSTEGAIDQAGQPLAAGAPRRRVRVRFKDDQPH